MKIAQAAFVALSVGAAVHLGSQHASTGAAGPSALSFGTPVQAIVAPIPIPRDPPDPILDRCSTRTCQYVTVAGTTTRKLVCTTHNFPNGMTCDDGDLCTTNDSCQNGTCTGTPVHVDDGNACTADSCDPNSGWVTHVPLPVGTVVQAATECASAKTCAAGGVATGAKPVPDWTSCYYNGSGSAYCRAGQCSQCEEGYCFSSNPPPWTCTASKCAPGVNGGPPDLTCWLDEHPQFKDHISWWTPGANWRVLYVDWTPQQKKDLADAFQAAWAWNGGQGGAYTGTAIPEPPPNKEAPYADESSRVYTVLDEATVAWPLYVARIAHTLAAEIGHWVPWSLCDYDRASLDKLFEVEPLFFRTEGFQNADGTPVTHTQGMLVLSMNVTPAHPTYVYSFLTANHLIGATRAQTIDNVLTWARGLTHYSGGGDLNGLTGYWQYAGNPPVSRTIDGTVSTTPDMHGLFAHWTMGCHGSTDLVAEVLRGANIPVESVEVCGHAMPHFMSENTYLSHGDDPYASFQTNKSALLFPMHQYVVDAPTWQQWFGAQPATDATCMNIGRRDTDLAEQYVPDQFAAQRCDDIAKGVTDPSQSSVYSNFLVGTEAYDSLADLDASGFWTRVDQRVTALGGCDAICAPYVVGGCTAGRSMCTAWPSSSQCASWLKSTYGP
jgi:hypothetical protein